MAGASKTVREIPRACSTRRTDVVHVPSSPVATSRRRYRVVGIFFRTRIENHSIDGKHSHTAQECNRMMHVNAPSASDVSRVSTAASSHSDSPMRSGRIVRNCISEERCWGQSCYEDQLWWGAAVNSVSTKALSSFPTEMTTSFVAVSQTVILIVARRGLRQGLLLISRDGFVEPYRVCRRLSPHGRPR